ncbi:diguanylate cyclase [Xenophilus arseniciresistens]|uniref:diguanylate cyclase n=1 Tax=Xenophilus arseniciresistens TaxID=1283306 RepID=A0AAE3N519_9BURK|nr:diguanylate cyclase [Xenophilus arseniciresistens]MDA7415023.1 diguanylate cyclase [Xenophilus arseniciresistens]
MSFFRSSDFRRREAGVVRLARVFVLFVSAVILGASAWMAWRGHADREQQIVQANANLASAVAQQLDALIGDTQNLLGNVAFALDQQALTAEALARIQPNLVNAVAQVRQLGGLFIFDAQGRAVVHTQPQALDDLDVRSRDYFVHHRESLSESVHIGEPLLGSISGRWLIPISRRLNDPAGAFTGVVLATLSVHELHALLAAYDVGQQGAIALLDKKGTVLLRRPLHEADLGRSIAGSEVHAQLLGRSQGTVRAASPIDGVQRLITFQHLRHYPLYVTVSLSTHEAFRSWRQSAVMQTAWAVVLCAMVGGSGIYLVRVIRRRARAEADSRQARVALEAANLKLDHMARHDGLTGLANRRHFDAEIERLLAPGRSPGAAVALLMIDVDHFKAYNDTHGHLAGDECLIRVAQAVRHLAVSSGGLAARFGGEELAVLLEAHPCPAAVAQEIRRAVEALRIGTAADPAARITVSIGIAVAAPGQGPAQLIARADGALYAAKRGGRNRIEQA